MMKSHSIPLLLSWLILVGAILLIVAVGFVSLDVHWTKAILFSIAGAICYGLVSNTGDRLDEYFSAGIQDFIRGGKDNLKTDIRVQRAYGALLITLLPLLVYLLLLAVYLAISFVEYGSILIARIGYFQLAGTIGLGVVAIGTIVAFLVAVRSLILPSQEDISGIDVTKADHPHFWHLVQTTAERFGAKPVDRVVLQPTPKMYVSLSGSPILCMIGRGKQTLVLGVPTLHGLKLHEFSALLAHEYGHLFSRDMQWEALTYIMARSLRSALKALPRPFSSQSRSGAVQSISLIVSLNPAYWLLESFASLFFRVTRSFSRMCEVMADISAMELYGGRALKHGLLRIGSNDDLFERIMRSVIIPVYCDKKKTIPSLFTVMDMGRARSHHENKRAFYKRMKAQETECHPTHPPLRTRLNYSERFPEVESRSEEELVALFCDWGSLERRVTRIFNAWLTDSVGMVEQWSN